MGASTTPFTRNSLCHFLSSAPENIFGLLPLKTANLFHRKKFSSRYGLRGEHSASGFSFAVGSSDRTDSSCRTGARANRMFPANEING